MKELLLWMLTISLIIIIGGCAKIPEEQVELFKDNHPEQYEKVLLPELERQKDKMAMFRSYSRAYAIIEAVEEGREAPKYTGTYSDITETHMANGVICYSRNAYQAVAISCVKVN